MNRLGISNYSGLDLEKNIRKTLMQSNRLGFEVSFNAVKILLYEV